MKNILFITCSRIGDAVLTTGVLEEIKKLYPKAKVTIAVDPLPAPLFKDYPLLDELIVFSKEKHSKHWLTLWKKVAKQHWDWVIDLRGSVISYALLAKKRSIWKSTSNDRRHKVEQISSLVGFENADPTLWFSEKCLSKVQKLFEKDSPYLAVAPAANWVGKQWPIESFIKLLKIFMAKFPEAKVAIFAAPHEKSMVAPMIKELPSERTLSFIDCGLNLGEIAACIKQCQAFIGNDSGLMHISAAVKTPTIGLFGPSREENYGPWQNVGEMKNIVVRIPLTYEELRKTPGFSHQSQDCYMKDLSVDKVFLALEGRWTNISKNEQ